LNPDNVEQMDRYNELYHEFCKANHLTTDPLVEYVTSSQASEFIGCAKQDIRVFVYRKVMRKGEQSGSVLLEDVLAKKMFGFQERV
jgi:hypothetical protein